MVDRWDRVDDPSDWWAVGWELSQGGFASSPSRARESLLECAVRDWTRQRGRPAAVLHHESRRRLSITRKPTDKLPGTIAYILTDNENVFGGKRARPNLSYDQAFHQAAQANLRLG